MTYENAKTLFDGVGMELSELQYQQLSVYLKVLLETNAHMNLTAITEPSEIWSKHFLDSAMLLHKITLKEGASCIDVGTGAGFPGMVMAIFRPDLKITLLDSLMKRIGFLENAAKTLGLSNVTCVHGRAEEVAQNDAYREQYDMATARAVAAMPVLTEYCLPFVKVGGVFVAMKGPSEVADDAKDAAQRLGGDTPTAQEYTVEQVGTRQLFQIEKINATPKQYPRRCDKIKKQPL